MVEFKIKTKIFKKKFWEFVEFRKILQVISSRPVEYINTDNFEAKIKENIEKDLTFRVTETDSGIVFKLNYFEINQKLKVSPE